jgi:DNA-binding MarR family transcriptional regulator
MLVQKAHFGSVLAELDLTPMQAHALRLLEPDRPIPMSELAEHLSCDASNVTGIVDRLEGRGLVERRSADGDRRVKALAVTPAGAEVREQVVERMSTPPAWIAGMSADDRRALADILGRAAAANATTRARNQWTRQAGRGAVA